MKKLALTLTLVAMLTVACKKAQQPQQTTEPAPDTTQVQPAESTVTDTSATMQQIISGAVAQLGEHQAGSLKAVGSNPTGSRLISLTTY